MGKPAISVIVPLYNAEKYIEECLDSVLNQTFQDYEVIVVDDCSTDYSVAIVESYIPKFDGRLRLARTEKNSGGGGYVPRNIGLTMAHGEYVYFIDADDFILLTALETLYSAAKQYDADVVYTGARYFLDSPTKIRTSTDGEGNALIKADLKDEPVLRVDEQKENLRRFLFEGNFHVGWARFVRRDFLIENQIVFPEVIIGGDGLWVIHLYCCAKRFLRLPTPLYFYRFYDVDSVSRVKKTPAEQIALWLSAFAVWAKLKDNPEYCYAALEGELKAFFQRTAKEMRGLSATDIYEILSNEFAKRNDMFDATVPFLLSIVTAYKRFFLEGKPEVKSSPAISVIISLFNYGKYIGELLDSLLAQTFKDFEVIIIDDCSTDNGVAVVERYIPEFGGRLHLTQTEKNSGCGSIPRNIGLKLASGKYVYFMDSDDALTETALEKMYFAGERFDAEVVYCEKYFMSTGRGQEFKDNVHLAKTKIQRPPFVKEPTLETDNLDERIQRAVNFNYWVTPWLRLVRRDLLIENGIEFPPFTPSEDVVWSFKILFCAKRFLRIPNACYIRRIHDDSVSFLERTPSDYIHKWLARTIISLKDMDDFMKRIEFFQGNPEQRLRVLDFFVQSDFNAIARRCEDLTMYQMYEAVHRNFGDHLGEHAVLVSTLCAKGIADTISKKKDLSTEVANAFGSRLPLDIRINLNAKDGLQIVNASNSLAKISKPTWLNKKSITYRIMLYDRNLDLVAKAAVGGQISLWLSGIAVPFPSIAAGRICCHVDCTQLVINGETLIDTATPVWDNKPYTRRIDVEAGEEVKIHVEWLPHKNDA